VPDRVEHQRDRGEGLHRPVVEEEREAAALVLLGRDQLLEEPDPFPLFTAPFTVPPLPLRQWSRSALVLSQ
jgi:hypothetical protein